jgi:prenyltransferase beta subunit
MMGCLEYLEEFQRINLISWCQRRYDVKFSSYFEFNTLLDRAQEGFQGRTNKVPDSCYAFWIGASLKILASFDEVDFSQVDSFILNSCQSMGGGFSKYPDTFADILHSFYSVCWLSMRTHLEELDPLLAIRKSKADKFRARFSKS